MIKQCEADLQFAIVSDEYQMNLAIIAAISIFRRVQGILHIHILADNISDNTRKKVTTILDDEKGNNSFTIHDVCSDILYKGFRTNHALPLATYLRLLLPQLLQNIDKVVYLDTDILIARECSTNDFAINFTEPVAAVPDEHLAPIYNARRGTTFTSRDTFNSGVMLMNLQLIRETGLFDKVIVWLQENSDSFDQEALNMILKGKYFRLPEKFNTLKKTEETPLIIHYAGSNRKPDTGKGILFSTNYAYSTMPWVLFRENTPLKIGRANVALLFLKQLIAFMSRTLVTQPLKKIKHKKMRSKIGAGLGTRS